MAFDDSALATTPDADKSADPAVPEPTEKEAAGTTKLPSYESGPPETIWAEFFAHHRAADVAVRRAVMQLTKAGEHEHVVHLLQAALINGQSQPWMYEVLADSMKFAGRPDAEVQRVVLSLTDFGTANLENMMISGAYLSRFGRDQTALRMYRQASRMAPERAEPYIMGLRLARKLKQPDEIGWAAAGVLQYAWTDDYESLHHEAENAALEAEEQLAQSGAAEAAAALKQTIADAKRRDLQVTVTWNGTADLDLLVEEPSGTVCSFESPETIGGGIHLHDGYGPSPDNCVETYVCPRAVSGEYKVRVRLVFGEVVGKRAQVRISLHQGSDDAQTTTQTVVLSGEDSVISFKLENGRRDKPRTVSSRRLQPLRDLQMVEAMRFLQRPDRLSPEEAAVLRRFQEGRVLPFQQIAAQAIRPVVAGAVGYQPVVTNVNEGSVLTAGAVVSPDRRYVRIAVNPVFSTLTDVFTFSFVSGANPTGGRNTGLGGN